MIYVSEITTASGVTKLNPDTTVLTVTKGLVYKVHITFPKGSAGLMGVAIFKGGFQVWPSNRGVWFRGDDSIIDFDDSYLIENDPTQFVIKTYNTDDTYDHEVIVRIGLVSQDMFIARFLPTYAYEELNSLFERLKDQQEEERQKQIQQAMFTIE